MSYFNTTRLENKELQQSTSKALTQDECVLAYFHSYDNLGATPERVLRHFKILETLSDSKWHNTPVTSIRRSFSNLKQRGLIYKTDLMIMGDYGKEIHVWKLVK